VNFNDIQDPETRIQDQSILSMVFIAAAKLDFNILCNYRVNKGRSEATSTPPSADQSSIFNLNLHYRVAIPLNNVSNTLRICQVLSILYLIQPILFDLILTLLPQTGDK